MQLYNLSLDGREPMFVRDLMLDLCFSSLEGNGGVAQNRAAMKGRKSPTDYLLT